MNVANAKNSRSFFHVLQTSRKLQTATMTLAPGQSSGPKGNEHPASEQVLLVMEGEVLAEIGDEKLTLRKGDVVIVPRRVAHRFVNRAASPAVTFNVYAPPAYNANDED
jgi:mannose-6-phosphate isomerase-like protein (cupin superfamily)